MRPDDEDNDTPSLEFAALVVVSCVVGALLTLIATALWRVL